jgi:hypothetical protein
MSCRNRSEATTPKTTPIHDQLWHTPAAQENLLQELLAAKVKRSTMSEAIQAYDILVKNGVNKQEMAAVLVNYLLAQIPTDKAPAEDLD